MKHWSDYEPVGRTFDPGTARALIEPLFRETASMIIDLAARRALSMVIQRLFKAEYGNWVELWVWSVRDGGLVQADYSPEHSILSKDVFGYATVERVVAAFSEWWSVLNELSSAFASIREATSGFPTNRAASYAATRLLPFVLQRTNADDAWYGTFSQVLIWYLESAGYSNRQIKSAVNQVVEGRFESWIEPEESLSQITCAEIGESVALAANTKDEPQAKPAEMPDATAAWLQVRERGAAHYWLGNLPNLVNRDGHRVFIQGPERLRDPIRAQRMQEALDACRASAHRGEPLTFARLGPNPV